MESVRSSRNPRVAEAIRLHRSRRRVETGRTLLEGFHLLEEAVAAAAGLETVFICEEDEATQALMAGLDADLLLVARPTMAKLAGTKHPRGPVAIMTVPADQPIVSGSIIVSLGVGDPGNVGTLIRSAAAFGLGFLSGPGTADPWSPKVLRAGAGAHFRTPIERQDAVSGDWLRARGFTVVAAVVRGGESPERLHGMERCALLIGDEGAGLPIDVIEQADLLITVPMPGQTESLNAAVAGSLLAYELAKTAKDVTSPD